MPQKRDATQAHLHEVTQNGNGHDQISSLDPATLQAEETSGAPWAEGADSPPSYKSLIAPSAVGAETPKGRTDVKKVAARSPHNQEWIRRHECSEAHDSYWVIRDKNDRNIAYILPPDKVDTLAKFAAKAHIELLMNEQGDLFFTVVPFVSFWGDTYEYWTTMQEVMDEATKRWVKPVANRNGNRYEIEYPPLTIPDPEWPIIEWGELFGIAFRKRILTDGHPALRKFLGGK